MARRAIRAALLASAALLPLALSLFGAEPDALVDDSLSIVFREKDILFRGVLPDAETAEALAAAANSARPSLRVVNDGLVYDSSRPFPSLSLFRSLVREVGLSAHEGWIDWSPRELRIGGLTDSVVTSSVLRLRARPLLDGRSYVDRICIVPTEDLPEIPVVLSSGEKRRAFSFDANRAANSEPETFEPPGILLTKILPLISKTSDPGWLATGRATPRTMAASSTAAGWTGPPEVEVRFARNSFLLADAETATLTRLAGAILATPGEAPLIRLETSRPRSGTDAFLNWLSGRRITEIAEQLAGAGIDPRTILPEVRTTAAAADDGVVRLRIQTASPMPPGDSDVDP